MEPFLPDAVTLEVKWRGNDLPCNLNLLRAIDMPIATGTLDLQLLQEKYIYLKQDEMLDHKEFGQTLFSFLFPQAIRDKFFQLVGEAGERGVRITLNIDPDIPGIHTIPWERMYFPQLNQLSPLAIEPSFVFSRLLKTSNAEVTPKTRGCLRALLVLANPFPETDPLHFDEALEREKINAAFTAYPANVTSVETPKPVTLEAVLTCLEEVEQAFDILYFSGHGFWKPPTQAGGEKTVGETGKAFLIFDKADGSPDIVALDTFMERLNRTIQKKRLPRLIFLSACHTAIKENTREALLGFGPKLVEAGCPAVICMQESIEDPVARAFACKFFSELFKHGCIDLAVNRARAAIYEQSSWQWSIPVLFMNTRDGMLFWPNEQFQELLSKPYKYLKPFRREDAEFFKGRDCEIQSIEHAISEQKLTVVHGPDRIGLTSLMEAGVCSRLDSGDTLVLVISEYDDLASEIRSSLLASRLHIYLPFEGSDNPRKVLEDAISGCLRCGVNSIILVLDQFERALRFPPEQKEKVRDMLVDLLDQLEIVRVILVVHDDWRDALELWQEKIPDLVAPRIAIGPLHTDQVVEVINTPLITNRFPVKQMEYNLSKSIIPEDLAKLYEEVGRGGEDRQADKSQPVDSSQLQIVCDWLYRESVSLKKAIIEPDLYNNAGRADGILARTTADTLEWDFAAEPDLTKNALISMVGPDTDRWVEVNKIAPKQLDRDQVVKILERLVDFELLDCYRTAGTTYYAFANQTVQRMAIEMGGSELRMQYEAEGEIERIWRMWLVTQLRSESLPASDSDVRPSMEESRSLATIEQLRMLIETSGHLHPDNLRILLLLRSAVYHDEPADLW
ncbi:MAG: CHAT domain-containing protein, partial [Anaerolineales bacterium]